MIQYWVSQGNKWCDTCKIYISNNPASIRNHELGQRHKDNVAKRLNTMREEKAAKEKEQKQASRLLEQIEAKAKRSYEKDLATFREARDTNAQALIAEDSNQGIADGSTMSGDWEYDSSSGYYYNQKNNYYYDPNSGFYYMDSLGKWVTQEEALAAFQVSSASGPTQKKPSLGKPPSASENRPSGETKSASTSESGPPPGRVVSTPLNPLRPVKGATSSVAVKRKRPDEKPKAMSKEEEAALKAREAARKRVEEREKPLLGLYKR
ncbi:zinc finger protein ZOP1 isoform X2 [Sesamum indicum]|uniref:Zinc finger protein ZOP1 isoform X2 n=1 Tax=Sesamum indicum TaxID=4182 RepID=A0A8M8V4U4_SESIN|nr:zinc finger protein ZOP1 isoform X2 [Sesamum indicum]